MKKKTIFPVFICCAVVWGLFHVVSSNVHVSASSASSSREGISLQSTATDSGFSSEKIITTGAYGANAVGAADLDNDGDLDVFATSNKNDQAPGHEKIEWYENTAGDGTAWSAYSLAGFWDAPTDVVSADLDADGDLDLVVTAHDHTQRVSWFESNGASPPEFTEHLVTQGHGVGYKDVQVIDMNQDGSLDVLVAAGYHTDEILWFESDGGTMPSFTLHLIDDGLSEPQGVFGADLDSDGDIDVMATDVEENKVIWYESSGGASPRFTSHLITDTAGAVKGILSTDVDGDGDNDIIAAAQSDDTVYLFENDGRSSPAFRSHSIEEDAPGVREVYAIDIDLDADVDIVYAAPGNNTIAWLENLGTVPPSFQNHVLSTNVEGTSNVYAADVDNDGDPDVLSASARDDTVAWYENLGSPPAKPPDRPSDIPSSPTPSDGAADQTVEVTLSWIGGGPDGDDLTYDVYLEADDSTPNLLACEDVPATTCDPGTLDEDTEYYWRVVARYPSGSTTRGEVWSFSTGAGSGPSGGWDEAGSGSASRGGISDNAGASVAPSVAMASDGTLYVAWSDDSSGNSEIYVLSWDGSDWQEVGSGSASDGGISNSRGDSSHASIAIAPDDTVYVAWRDDSSGDINLYVRRWTGGDWEEVGTGSATGGGLTDTTCTSASTRNSIAVGLDSVPYLIWHEDCGSPEVFVRRWNGTAWEAAGRGADSGSGISNTSATYSYDPVVAISPDNIPHAVWHDDGRRNRDYDIYARRLIGNVWEEIGTGSASGAGIISPPPDGSLLAAIAFAPDSTLYVAWQDESSGDYEIYVRRWNGTDWEEVGTGSASGGGISNNDGISSGVALAVAPDGTPYVAWQDESSGDYEVYIRSWNGASWEEVGAGSASGGGISDNDGSSTGVTIAVDSMGVPYVVWGDDSSGDYEIYALRWLSAPDDARPEITGNEWLDAVPLPTEISTEPEVIGTNAGLALLFALGFGLTSALFNATLEENEELIQSHLAPLLAPFRRMAARLPRPEVGPRLRRARPFLLLLFSALLYAFIDPGFGISVSGLIIFFSLFIALTVLVYSYKGVQILLGGRLFKLRARFQLYPVALLFGVVCVLLTRWMDFHPGYLYGFVAGFAFLGMDRDTPRRWAVLVLVGSLAALTASLAAWGLAVPVAKLAANGVWGSSVLYGVLVAIFVAGLEGLLFTLVPLTFMDGAKVMDWSRIVWGVMFALSAWLFFHVLINPGSAYFEALTDKKVILMIATLAVYSLVTGGTWYFFRWHARRRAQADVSE